jgi:hypothetical protein
MTKDPRDPNRWTNREIEPDSEAYLAAQAAHAEDWEEGERQRREADDLASFTERFVEAGVKSSEAAPAFREHKADQAAEAASRADAETLRASRSRPRHSL